MQGMQPSASRWIAIAKERREQGDPRAAIVGYRAALERGAPAADMLGRFQEAARAPEQALEIAPDPPGARFGLGLNRFARIFLWGKT